MHEELPLVEGSPSDQVVEVEEAADEGFEVHDSDA